MRYISILIIVLISFKAINSYADCIDSYKVSEVINYSNESRGLVTSYVVEDLSLNLVNCLISSEVIKKVYDFPDKFVLNIINKDFSSGLTLQWNITSDYLLLINYSLKGKAYSGLAITNPGALSSLQRIVSSSAVLPGTEAGEYLVNLSKVSMSESSLFYLIYGERRVRLN